VRKLSLRADRIPVTTPMTRVMVVATRTVVSVCIPCSQSDNAASRIRHDAAIPADRRSPSDRNDAFSDLDYALYLGPGTDTADMTTTDVDPAELPLDGLTSTAEVPFGDTVLTLVTSPRGHLGTPPSEPVHPPGSKQEDGHIPPDHTPEAQWLTRHIDERGEASGRTDKVAVPKRWNQANRVPDRVGRVDPILIGAGEGLRTQEHSGGSPPVARGTAWTTDAPYRETTHAIAAARAAGVLAVEMEAASLYAFSQARNKPVACFAHITNQMGVSHGDFEKGEADGTVASLRLLSAVARSWLSQPV